MNLLGKYTNGNYQVSIYDDGTKIRENDLDTLEPSFAECMDVKFTHKCSQGCAFCYEGCTSEGKHSDILKQPWIYSLHPHTEIAINGNDLDHPDLIEFLSIMRESQVIVNITVNQNQFLQHFNFLNLLSEEKFIKGIGVSLIKANKELADKIKLFPNLVIHTINGILTKEDLKFMNRNTKLLILGYKDVRRGKSFKESNQELVAANQAWLYKILPALTESVDVCSFDNLALEQLNVRRFLTDEQWNEFYMGDDGQYTFYIDAVNQTFAKNSIISELENFPINNQTVDEMFTFIKSKYETNKKTNL